MDQQHYGLNMVVHAHSKRGKTWFAETTPAPRLVLDAEAGSRFTPSRKKFWNPNVEGPPEYDGSWDTTLVPVLQFRDVLNAYSWLNSGQHPFRSVIIDSLSEIQQRIIDDISGTQQMRTQDWGELLRKAVDFIRKFRDLVVNPVKPLDAVIYITMTKQRNDGVWIPYAQGSLATVLPYFMDVCAYLDYAPLEDGNVIRRLYVGPLPGYETGERVGGRLGRYVDIPEGDLKTATRMLEMIRGNGQVE